MKPEKQPCILWPTDLSDHSLRAAGAVNECCQILSARLIVLHVYHSPLNYDALATCSMRDELMRLDSEMESRTRSRLEQLAMKKFASVNNVATETVSGTGCPEICGFASTNDVNLIVVSTHARTGLRHLLLGSVAEDIIRQAPCPVLVINDKSIECIANLDVARVAAMPTSSAG